MKILSDMIDILDSFVECVKDCRENRRYYVYPKSILPFPKDRIKKTLEESILLLDGEDTVGRALYGYNSLPFFVSDPEFKEIKEIEDFFELNPKGVPDKTGFLRYLALWKKVMIDCEEYRVRSIKLLLRPLGFDQGLSDYYDFGDLEGLSDYYDFGDSDQYEN